MRPLRVALCASIALSLAVGPAAGALAASAEAPAAAGKGPRIAIGTGPGFSKLEIQGPQPRSVKREGSDILLRFGRVEPPDIARLKIDPPKHLKAAKLETGASGVVLRLTLDEGADARIGKADGATFVNISAPDAAEPAPVSRQNQRLGDRPNPAPADGVVHMKAEMEGRNLLLRFPWRAPLGAAVFRRGDALWLVFDAPAKLDLKEAPRGLPQMRGMQAVQGADFSAIRIAAPATTVPTLTAERGNWTLALGPAAVAAPDAIRIGRDESNGPPVLTAQVAGVTGVFWVADPVVGDKVAVVTALAPAKGLPAERAYVDAALLPSWHGLAVRAIADDVTVAADHDLVRIGRPRGLALSAASVQPRRAQPAIGLPQPSGMPALVDYANWSRTGPGGFNARYAELQTLAAEELAKGKAAGVQARLALARFLVGSELNHEAIGVLNGIIKAQPGMAGDGEVRGLRAAARAMIGRYKDAQADLSSPALLQDSASALWRGYVAAKLGDYTGARQQLAAGWSVLPRVAPKWRARFAVAGVDASLAAGDLRAAQTWLAVARQELVPRDEAAAVQLAEARVADAAGQTDRALALYDDVSKAPYGALAAPALLRSTELKLEKGRINSAAAIATLDSLRFRWRGGLTELETIRSLGRIYIGQGRYREALQALRSAGQRLPDLPAAVALQQDLAGAFKTLFLDGGADGMQPIQALALFYDFKELTPIGAEGDMMVRKLSKRLVDVDLLDQAAELLKYQAENRLDGVPRAEVATDLAVIQLMNQKPEDALIALANSRTTLLPNGLNAERRVIEARALAQLGRYDHALELLGKDNAPEAAEVRSEIAWKQRDWALAGKLIEARLGDRWKSEVALSPEEETKVLRAGAAYSLAGDDVALARMRARYSRYVDQTRTPEAMRVALSGADDVNLTTARFAQAVSDADAFAGWVQRMKKRFADKPAAKTQAQAATPAKKS